MRSGPLIRGSVVALALAASFPAEAQKVVVETDGAFNFMNHRRYQWREHPLAEKDPVMQSATVAREVIRSRVNETLMAKGFEPVDGAPDFYVTYFAGGNITEELRVIAAVGSSSWYGWGSVYTDGWVKYGLDQHINGFLVIDFVAAETSQLAWRAVCKDTIKDLKKRTDNITRAVDKAMKKFPPKPAAAKEL
jgi:hypothetical protein